MNEMKKTKPWDKVWRFLAILFGIALVVCLIFQSCENRNLRTRLFTANTDNKYLRLDNDSLRKEVSSLRNQKAIPEVDTIIQGSREAYVVSAKIVSGNDCRDSEVILPALIKMVPYRVEVPVNLDTVKFDTLQPSDCGRILCEEEIKEDSIEIIFEKTTPEFLEPVTLKIRKISIKDLLWLYENQGSEKAYELFRAKYHFAEYVPNPYRQKAENCFWRGVIFGGGSATLYTLSEAVGHPKYYDDRDNSDAEQLSKIILCLRINSGILAAASIFEFGRAWHFHNLEGNFIVSPTGVGVKVNLDKK